MPRQSHPSKHLIPYLFAACIPALMVACTSTSAPQAGTDLTSQKDARPGNQVAPSDVSHVGDQSGYQEATPVPAQDLAAVVAAQNAFAAKLWGKLMVKSGNLAVSPHSIASVLTLAMAGTQGATYQAFRATLGYDLPDAQVHAARAEMDRSLQPRSAVALSPQVLKHIEEEQHEVQQGNAVWLQQGWQSRPSFLAMATKYYAGGFHQVDFAGNPQGATDHINNWVAEQTKQRITQLFAPLPPTCRLALVNAIWLKASWVDDFEPSLTKLGDFRQPNGKIRADFMNDGDSSMSACHQIPGGTVALRACRGNTLSLFVVTPTAVDGLPGIERLVTTGALPGWINNCTVQRTKWRLPKVKLEQQESLDLTAPLVALGLGPAFELSADFSPMATASNGETPLLGITQLVHKVFFSVDEYGMEAAAATGMAMAGSAAPTPKPKPIPVNCDRPFLWGIWNQQTKAVLFLGRIADPTKGL